VHDPLGKLLSFAGGALLIAVFGKLGVEAFHDYRRFDDAPARTALLAAVEASSDGRRWVTVEGAAWRCAELVRGVPGGAAFLPARAEDGSTVVARFDREIRCDAAAARPLTGIIEPMAPERAADLRGAGLVFAEGTRLRTLEVCAACGKANARLGVVMCAAFVLLGLALYPLRLAYQARWGRARAALRAAVHAPAELAPKADRTVRAWGAAALATGAAALLVGRGWVAYGVVPVRWIGALALVLGGWMVASPASYRRLARRGARR
jgi:hypothetical protein